MDHGQLRGETDHMLGPASGYGCPEEMAPHQSDVTHSVNVVAICQHDYLVREVLNAWSACLFIRTEDGPGSYLDIYLWLTTPKEATLANDYYKRKTWKGEMIKVRIKRG